MALAVLAVVGITAIRSSGRNLVDIADSARHEAVYREGRNRFYEILARESARPRSERELNHWGTLAPRFPDVDFTMRAGRLKELPGLRVEFSVKDRAAAGREQRIDYVLPE